MNQTFFALQLYQVYELKEILVDDICHLLTVFVDSYFCGKARDRLGLLSSLISLPRLVICRSFIDCRFCVSGKAGGCSVGSIFFDRGCIS